MNDNELPGMWSESDFSGGESDSAEDQRSLRDCPTCAYSHKAECLAPGFRAMSYNDQRHFWREKTPCRFWKETTND